MTSHWEAQSINSITHDVELIKSQGSKIGLDLNSTKCELICQPGGPPSPIAPCLTGFTTVSVSDAMLLGAPLFTGSALDQIWASRCDMLKTVLGRLKALAAHDALILLRSCYSAPKVLHLLRCSPSFGHHLLSDFDGLLKSGLMDILNCDLSDSQWLQASLPVRDGGLGVRRVAVLAPSAFLASAASTLSEHEYSKPSHT